MSDMFAMVEAMAKPKKEFWRSVGEKAMVRGEYTICQYGEKPNEDYALFGRGPEMLAHGKTHQEMMDEADRCSQGVSV